MIEVEIEEIGSKLGAHSEQISKKISPFLMSCSGPFMMSRLKVGVDSGSPVCPVYGWSQFALVWTNFHNLTWAELFAWGQVVFKH